MKLSSSLILIFVSFFSGSFAFGFYQFDCKSDEGSQRTISVQGQEIHLEDKFHSANSVAKYIGVESAPHSLEKGFLIYSLVDFYKTEDSFFYIKMDPDALRKSEFKLIEGFNHDDVEENVIIFNCKKEFKDALLVKLPKSILENSSMNFISRPNALAMNIRYQPILDLRPIITNRTGLLLKFFDKWSPDGEAHITTLTPPEMVKILTNNEKYMTAKRVDEIARQMQIQNSKVTIEGMGSRTILLSETPQTTFFVIVKSQNLLDIRHQVYKEFIANGGDPNSWNPDNFYPHITVGYTERDLYESDGVLKDMQHSEDKRFVLELVD